MKYQSFTGIGKRENNEDVILIEKFSQEVELYLVVDGMGGYEKGEVSARLVAENISTHLRTVEIINKTEINNAIKKANLAVKQFNESNKIASGATVAGIVFQLDIALCFWLGDVQIYHFLNGNLDWQSKGHTLLNEFLETDANRSPEMQKRYGHIVTKSVAGKREKSTPEILEIKNISEKDSFVLCSDGVHNTLTVDHLRLLLSENDNLTQIQEYLKIHADDNYSLILVNN